MRFLLFIALLLAIIIVVDFLWNPTSKFSIRILKALGILTGFLALGLNNIIDDSFGASTPTNVVVHNQTDTGLNIYAIAFWKDDWTGNFVTFDKMIGPNDTSDFWFENDGTEEFWIIGKDDNDSIKFLEVVSDKVGEYNFEISESTTIKPNQAILAKELTDKKDKSLAMEKYIIWVIYGLIVILFLSMLKDFSLMTKKWL